MTDIKSNISSRTSSEEIGIMDTEFNKYISGSPQGEPYVNNWKIEKRSLDDAMSDTLREMHQWMNDHPEYLV